MKKVKVINYEEIKYVEKIVRLQKKIDTISKKRLLFWGCGACAGYIWNVCDFNDIDVRFCDEKKAGGVFYDNIIEVPEYSLVEWADFILPTMFYNRDSFNLTMKKYNVDEGKIIDLYYNTDHEPINCISVDLDLEKCDDICDESEYGKRNKYDEWSEVGLAKNYDMQVENYFFDEVISYYYKKYLIAGSKVLDFGAGSGRLSLFAEKNGCDVTAVDINQEMLDIINRKSKNIKTLRVGEQVLPFDDEAFDIVMSYDVLIHIADWKNYIKEHYRVLKKGGYMIHGILNDDHLKSFSSKKHIRCSYISGDYKNYMTTISKEELYSVCDNLGLSIVEQIPLNFFTKTAFSKEILTRWEMHELGAYIVQLCRNEDFRHIIGKFEKEIVSNLPAEMTAYNIVVIKKGGSEK